MNIGKRIVTWFHTSGRDMPWRETRDPYQIWIAEIILQQTRIAQGIDYFYRFIERFPDVAHLADAHQDEVLKYWEGLGYYSRARNLHAAAKQVVSEYGGKFPTDHDELINLKGVGPYTSRAIGSFAFGNQVGVIDGNVLRVMSRILGDSAPVNEISTRKRFQVTIDEWVKGVDSRTFNHGIMDIGSVICTPKKPGCLICPLQDVCIAHKQGMTALLPVKKKTLVRKTRYFNFYLAFNDKKEIAIRQRPQTGFWGGLWELPNTEIESKEWKKKNGGEHYEYHHELKHVFTHFDMMIHVFVGDSSFLEKVGDYTFIPMDNIPIFAFAKAILKIFDRFERKKI